MQLTDILSAVNQNPFTHDAKKIAQYHVKFLSSLFPRPFYNFFYANFTQMYTCE